MGACYSGPPRLPVFNITCNIWFGNQANPPMPPPNLPAMVCQLCPGEFLFGSSVLTGMYLKLPALTNVHYARAFPLMGADVVECPAGSGHYYIVAYVNDVGRGFSNGYRFVRMSDLAPIPDPIP